MTIVFFWYRQLLVFTVTIRVSVSYYEGDRVFVGTVSLPYMFRNMISEYHSQYFVLQMVAANGLTKLECFHWHALPVLRNVTLKLSGPIHELRR
jgi:hypothetical protein